MQGYSITVDGKRTLLPDPGGAQQQLSIPGA
jgi:hypothetical protein